MRCLQVLARANLTPLNAMDASDGSVLQTLERHGLVTHEKRHSWHRQGRLVWGLTEQGQILLGALSK